MTELESLCADLVSGDDTRAEAAAVRLPRLGLVANDALRSLLKAQEADTRWWAVRALAGFINLDEAYIDLIAALEDSSREVRQAAALAFSLHPDPRALPILAQSLGDADPLTAKLASNALIMSGKQSTDLLLDVLKNGKPSARLEAARALAEIMDTRAIPGLMEALETDSALLQYWAVLGLEKMGAGMIYIKPE